MNDVIFLVGLIIHLDELDIVAVAPAIDDGVEPLGGTEGGGPDFGRGAADPSGRILEDRLERHRGNRDGIIIDPRPLAAEIERIRSAQSESFRASSIRSTARPSRIG